MDSDILNIEEIVMGGLPDPPPVAVPPAKPADVFKTPSLSFKPPSSSVQPYQHENLQCFQCFITFCNAKAKERHMKKSHREEYKQQLQQGNTLFTCYVCDRSFPSSEELTAHQPTHSKEDKPFKCVYCQESFRIFSELTTHRRQVCPERHFLCKDCNQTFRSHGLLRTHRLAQHPRSSEGGGAAAEQHPDHPDKTHRCSKCGQGFQEEAQLLEHQEKYAAGETCNGNAIRKRGRPPKADDSSAAPEKKARRKKKEAEPSGEAESGAAAAATPGGGAEAKAKAGGGAKRGRPAKAATATSTSSDKESSENAAAAAPPPPRTRRPLPPGSRWPRTPLTTCPPRWRAWRCC